MELILPHLDLPSPKWTTYAVVIYFMPAKLEASADLEVIAWVCSDLVFHFSYLKICPYFMMQMGPGYRAQYALSTLFPHSLRISRRNFWCFSASQIPFSIAKPHLRHHERSRVPNPLFRRPPHRVNLRTFKEAVDRSMNEGSIPCSNSLLCGEN